MHPGRDHAVAVHHGLEDDLRDQPGLVAHRFERCRLQRDVARHAFELEGRADPLRCDHVVVHAAECVLRAIGALVDYAPFAAGA